MFSYFYFIHLALQVLPLQAEQLLIAADASAACTLEHKTLDVLAWYTLYTLCALIVPIRVTSCVVDPPPFALLQSQLLIAEFNNILDELLTAAVS